MKYILFCFLIFIASCGVKQTRNQLASGNYDEAIENAIRGLRNNKNKKGNQDYIYLLEEAFAKAKERDQRQAEMLVKDNHPENLERLYTLYVRMHERQEMIRPLLPLRFLKEQRDAIFPFEDYSDKIIDSKRSLASFLYDNSKKLISGSKMDARKAYDDLTYLEKLIPNYKETAKLKEQARFRGTDFVSVVAKNETGMLIPLRLQNDLLDFSTFGLNDKWTAYHSNRQREVDYDYGVIINFRNISISPEQVKEKEFHRERQVKAGLKKLLDANGNVVKDSLGNAIMVDNFKTVTIKIYEFRQFKACQVTAKVDYIDFNNDQLLDSYPLTSEFIFENIYARYKGDRRAADENYLPLFDGRAVPFPSNEQMVFDTGEELKAKLKTIISRNKFRR